MMMKCPMMMGGGGTFMMIAMGVIWLLTAAVLILGIAALLKYCAPARGDRGRIGRTT